MNWRSGEEVKMRGRKGDLAKGIFAKHITHFKKSKPNRTKIQSIGDAGLLEIVDAIGIVVRKGDGEMENLTISQFDNELNMIHFNIL